MEQHCFRLPCRVRDRSWQVDVHDARIQLWTHPANIRFRSDLQHCISVDHTQPDLGLDHFFSSMMSLMLQPSTQKLEGQRLTGDLLSCAQRHKRQTEQHSPSSHAVRGQSDEEHHLGLQVSSCVLTAEGHSLRIGRPNGNPETSRHCRHTTLSVESGLKPAVRAHPKAFEVVPM